MENNSVEALLKPRYKVIAIWPGSYFDVDEIIYVDDEGDSMYYDDNGRVRIKLSLWPHLFKRLEWWEDRDEKELPEYVKTKDVVYSRAEAIAANRTDVKINGSDFAHYKSFIILNSAQPATGKEHSEYQLKLAK